MKDQHPALHPLDAALLLIASALQAAIDRDYLGNRQALGLEDPLGPGTFLTGVQLRDPYPYGTMSAAEPFEGGIGKEMGRYAGMDPAPSLSATEEPSSDAANRDKSKAQQLGHSRNQPRRRNQI
jgi:hypothetical protein